MGKRQDYRSGASMGHCRRAVNEKRWRSRGILFEFDLATCLRDAAYAVILLVVTAIVALAQTQQPPLSLDDCVHLAIAAPSSVTVARQQSEIARYGLTQARAGFLPQARVNNLVTYNSPLLYDRQTFSFVAL